MNVPPAWRPALDAALKADPTPAARHVQLATVRPDGLPAVRTVVFRGFLSDDRLTFTADTRSEKAGHLNRFGWAEVCWYFAATREQFRFLGMCGPILAEFDNDRGRVWRELSGPSRQSFVWPQPGDPRSPDEAFRGPAPADPPPNFMRYVLCPGTVDHLDLRPHPHERTVYKVDGPTWGVKRVNP